MKKYKLNNDAQKAMPSEEQILKYKSFDKLRTSYEDVVKPSKQPLYKNRRLFMLLILIGAVAWAIYETSQDESSKEKEKTEQKK